MRDLSLSVAPGAWKSGFPREAPGLTSVELNRFNDSAPQTTKKETIWQAAQLVTIRNLWLYSEAEEALAAVQRESCTNSCHEDRKHHGCWSEVAPQLKTTIVITTTIMTGRWSLIVLVGPGAQAGNPNARKPRKLAFVAVVEASTTGSDDEKRRV